MAGDGDVVEAADAVLELLGAGLRVLLLLLDQPDRVHRHTFVNENATGTHSDARPRIGLIGLKFHGFPIKSIGQPNLTFLTYS